MIYVYETYPVVLALETLHNNNQLGKKDAIPLCACPGPALRTRYF